MLHPTPVRESYDSDSSTSRLPSESASRNVSLGRLSDEEAEEPPLPDEEAVAIWQRLDDGGHMPLVEPSPCYLLR